MMINLSPVELLAGIGALIVLAFAWRASLRRARRIATAARESARLATLTGRVLLTAAIFGGVQWIVITHPGNVLLTVTVFGLPDLLAGFVLARALTVTTVDTRATRRGGGHR